jgi:large subunit ribosomal protein L24
VSKIRQKDQVVVLSGKDKGRRGTVVKVLEDGRIVVEGVNMTKKHQKPRNTAGGPAPGGIIEREAPLAAAKVAIWNPAGKKGDRVGYRRLADGRKVRIFKSNGEQIDV